MIARLAAVTISAAVLIAVIAMAWVVWHENEPKALTTLQAVATGGLGYLASLLGHRKDRDDA